MQTSNRAKRERKGAYVMSRKRTWRILLALLSIVCLALVLAQAGLAQVGSWTKPIIISGALAGSWFPDLAVDHAGNVHVVWCDNTALKRQKAEQVYYSRWNGQEWSAPNDIVPPSVEIIRNAIAVDNSGYLHLLFGGSVINTLTTYYTRTPLESAWSAGLWASPHAISSSSSYMSDIAVDLQGTIHVVYDQHMRQPECDPLTETCPIYADVFYRHSADGGQTWTQPKNLSRSPIGSSRLQMEIDIQDTVYVVWDEGWDRLSGEGEPVYGAYTFSRDRGQTWSQPVVFSYPEGTNAQTTVGVDGRGGVLVVWRAISRDEIYYTWSSDYGVSWSPPRAILDLFARPWQTPFDMYDMTTDSMGHIHLVAVGRLSPEEDSLGVYHLEWDGTAWSPPTAIYWGGGFPEYPKVVISEGNKLHAAWFVRDALWEGGNRKVWYSSSQSASPAQTPIPPSTSAPTPTATPLATATPTATPYPTLAPGGTALPDGLRTESDDLLRLFIGSAPVLILIATIVILKVGRLKRLS